MDEESEAESTLSLLPTSHSKLSTSVFVFQGFLLFM